MVRENAFRSTKSIQDRKAESQNKLDKNINTTPIILQSYSLPLTRQRFLVPSDMMMAQFHFFIRKKLKVRESHAIYMFVETVNPLREQSTGSSIMLPDGLSVGDAYARYSHIDGFMYCFVEEESTFGN